MAHNKRIIAARALMSNGVFYDMDAALELLMKYGASFKAKMDETVEVVLRLGVDPRHSDQVVRGVVSMPNGLGKMVRVAVFAQSERHKEAISAGADIVGGEELIEKVKGGQIDFEVCIATPDFMPKMAALGKILGSKGMMPNPKLGTVSNNIDVAVKNVKFGQVEYKAEKSGLIHAGVGKLSFAADAIKQNILSLYDAVVAAKPAGAKGIYMQKMYIGTTHGPSIPIDLKSIYR